MPGWYLWLQAAQAALWILLSIYTWQSKQRSADRCAVKAIELAQDALDRRVVAIEERQKFLPSVSDISQLQGDVGIMKERTENHSGWLERMGNQLDRIDNWLREKG
jgi:hypothetical protein